MPGAPLLARLEHDGGVVHIERRVIGRAVGASHGAEDARDFGKGAEDRSCSCSSIFACSMEMPGSAVGM